MAGIITTTIAEDGGEYFTKETLALIKKLQSYYLPQIVSWIQQAEIVLQKDRMETGNLYRKTFFGVEDETYTMNDKTYKTGRILSTRAKPGVGFKSGVTGGTNTSVSLASQWESVVLSSKHQQAQDVGNELTNRTLLTKGYYILTRVGEEVRNDIVRYRVVVHDNSGGFINRATEWDLDLTTFLNLATHQANGKNYYDTGLSGNDAIRSRMYQNNVQGREWEQAEINDFNLFVNQVKGFVELHGKAEKHTLASKVAGANMGHLMEAYLQLGFTYRFRQKGNKFDWQEVKHQIDAVLSVLSTLEKPSAFWQGGEGGSKLQNTQVKASGASLTNMTSLVRQMTRLYAILTQLSTKVGEKVKQDTLHHSLQFSDDEVIEALINMFDRDSWNTWITINL